MSCLRHYATTRGYFLEHLRIHFPIISSTTPRKCVHHCTFCYTKQPLPSLLARNIIFRLPMSRDNMMMWSPLWSRVKLVMYSSKPPPRGHFTIFISTIPLVALHRIQPSPRSPITRTAWGGGGAESIWIMYTSSSVFTFVVLLFELPFLIFASLLPKWEVIELWYALCIEWHVHSGDSVLSHLSLTMLRKLMKTLWCQDHKY